jgi:hypothetical protein
VNRPIELPAEMAGRMKGWDAAGNPCVSLFADTNSPVFPMTPCCNAAATYASDGDCVCKACYNVVDDYYAGTAVIVTPFLVCKTGVST